MKLSDDLWAVIPLPLKAEPPLRQPSATFKEYNSWPTTSCPTTRSDGPPSDAPPSFSPSSKERPRPRRPHESMASPRPWSSSGATSSSKAPKTPCDPSPGAEHSEKRFDRTSGRRGGAAPIRRSAFPAGRSGQSRAVATVSTESASRAYSMRGGSQTSMKGFTPSRSARAR